MNILWIFVLLLSKLYFHISGEIITYKTKYPYHIARKMYPKPTKSINYCKSLLCQKNVRHLTCETKFWGPKCGKSHEGVRLKKCMKNILDLHNTVRTRLNQGLAHGLPQANKLPLFEWDDELALMAMRITNQCNEETANLCVNTYRFPNVAVTSDFVDLKKHPAKGMSFFVQNWWNQYRKILPVHVAAFPANASREMWMFANIAYRKTHLVGCGMLDSGTKRFVTCVYNDKVGPGKRLYNVKPTAVNVSNAQL
ncbi:venom allergen 3-like [Drosophila miranda]|uniref:venom allergen 3-like n=1 Tax=Drosophila miranda TaxID=7229 RepID=UPI00143F59BB|nr:venom allergen 3-like [Drosophila miranda]